VQINGNAHESSVAELRRRKQYIIEELGNAAHETSRVEKLVLWSERERERVEEKWLGPVRARDHR
jgi:hypothetical protein